MFYIKNLSELGFEEYCINISEVKKDRRKVINKVRDILLNLNKGDHLFTEEKTKEKKYFYSSTEEKIVNEKIIKVQEVISLINKTKKNSIIL